MSDVPLRLPLAALAADPGFRPDARFRVSTAEPAETPQPEVAPEPAEPGQPEDPLTGAFAEGFAAGADQARALAEQEREAEAGAYEKLQLSFARLDKALEEELRLRLRDTVAALCEAAIAPYAVDEDMLVRRIEIAVSMLARADDERVIRLNPDDMKMIAPRLCAEWEVSPDPALERGSLRVESSNGGVEDGPAIWRRAIAEALHQC